MGVIFIYPLMSDPQLAISAYWNLLKVYYWRFHCESYRPTYQKLLKCPQMSSEIWILPFPGCLSFYVSTLSHNPNTWHNISAKPAIRRCDPNRRQRSLRLAANAQGREEERKAPSHQQLNNSFIYAHTPSHCKCCLNTDESRAPTRFPAYYRLWITRNGRVLSIAFI